MNVLNPADIQQLYVQYFGRPADPAGLAFWVDAGATNNATLAQIQANFATSPEYVATFKGLSYDAIVNKVFQNLFSRDADPVALNFYSLNMSKGLVTVTSIAADLMRSVNTTHNADYDTIQAKVQVASAFTTALDTTTERLAYGATPASLATAVALVSATTGATVAAELAAVDSTIAGIVTVQNPPPAPPVAQTFTLTTGIDNGTAFTGGAGNDSFNAVDNSGGTSSTWGALDVIDGGAGTNTFTVASGVAITQPAGATVSNIQTAVIAENGAAATITLNTTSWTGLTTLNVTQGGTGVDTLTAAATTGVTHTGNSTGAINIVGGNGVTVTTIGGNVKVGSTALGGTTAATAVGAISVTDTTSAASTIAVDGGSSVTIVESGATGAAAIGVGANVQTTGAVSVTATTGSTNADAIGTITIKGGSSITVNELAGDAAATGTNVTMGAVNITGTAATTTVTVNQATAATGLTAVTAVTGVTGVTAVPAAQGTQAVALVTAVSAAAAVAGLVGVADGAVTITDKSYNTSAANTIAAVTLSNYAAGSAINDNALKTLSLSGVAGSLTITNATNGAGGVPATNATLGLTVNALSGTNTIADANAEITTLNVTTGATASNLAAFTDASLTALNIAGSSTFTLGTINSSLTSIVVSGAAGYNDGGTTSHAAAYTGFGSLGAAATLTTTSSGAITAHLDDTTQTFVGSTGKDTITVSALADATKVITGGSGATDELVLEGGAYALTSATGAKITGFETLGVAANVTGTIDMSALGSSFTGLHIVGNSTIAFSKVAANTALTLDVASTSVTYGVVNATGAADSVTVNLGKATSDTVNFGTIVLQDANAVGIGSLNLVSNGVDITSGDSTANNNTIVITDNGLSTLNVSGTQGLAITTINETATQATSFTLNNTNTGSFGVVVGTLTDTNLGALTFTGAGASTITTLTDASSTTLAISNTGSKMATVGTFTSTAALTSLTLSGNVQIGNGLVGGTGLTDTNTTGVTVSGASDNAHVKLILAGATVGLTNNVTLGNGNDVVTDATIAGTSNVTVGTGSNSLTIGGTTTNTTGAFNITLGSHTATTGSDFITVGTGGTAYATAANYVITGAAIGDRLIIAHDAGATLVGTGLTAGAGTITATTAAATLALSLTALESAATAAHGVATVVFGGNTYVAESASGTLAGTDTTIVELVGTHTLSATNATGYLVIAS